MTLRLATACLLFLAAFGVSACNREKIRVYTAAKETPQQQHDHNDAPPASAENTRPPQNSNAQNRLENARKSLQWKLPEGWREAEPNQVSAAQFVATGPAGDAGINITPLPNLQGKEAMVVNMWREQLGQPPLDPAQIGTALAPIEIAGQQGSLFEISGKRDGADQQIITAMLHRPDASWFFKLSGPTAAVAAQKDALAQFLKSVRIDGNAAATQP